MKTSQNKKKRFLKKAKIYSQIMDWKVDLNMQRYIGEPTPKRLMG